MKTQDTTNIIQDLRNKMIIVAESTKTLLHPDVITMSQTLDVELLPIQRKKLKEYESKKHKYRHYQ